MSNEQIKSLIERLEAATGPDAQIDDTIQWLCVPQKDHTINAPRFTKSIDAALTLVPEGYGWSISDYRNNQAGLCAFVHPPDPKRDLFRSNETRSTPAIALCIASLRARLT
jgi:hypothetical protein